MTELAGRSGLPRVARPARRMAGLALSRRPDCAGGLCRAGDPAAVHRQQGAARFRHPLLGLRACSRPR